MTAAVAATATTPKLLRAVVLLDGFATLPSGVLVAALAGVLDDPLGIPSGALLGVGVFFIVWGALVLFLGFRPVVNRRAALAVGIVNMVCAVDGFTIQLAGVGELTTLGSVLLVVVSVLVLAIGVLQVFAATRRSPA